MEKEIDNAMYELYCRKIKLAEKEGKCNGK